MKNVRLKYIIIGVLFLGSLFFLVLSSKSFIAFENSISKFFKEVEFEETDQITEAPLSYWQNLLWERFKIKNFDEWQRPTGPLRVGLQVGHLKTDELPDELEHIRIHGGGTKGGGKSEWEINQAIALQIKEILELKGVVVDILPATVPVNYWADVFLAIHADGNYDRTVSGFKAAGSWRDYTNKRDLLVTTLEEEYQKVTKMNLDTNITHNMRGYYAFNWMRYEHAVHPMTTMAIIETGFLTNSQDQKIIINQPKIAAQGIANGIMKFFDIMID